MIDAYIYTSCTSCRKTIAQLTESGAQFQSRDYFRKRFTREELKAVLAQAELKPSDILSTRSRPYTAMDLASKSLSEDDILDLMLNEPRLLKRPLVIGNGKVVVGHNESKLAELIAGG
ncbi:MAG: arsenate reductase family protein [Thermomicrobiales bacterium]